MKKENKMTINIENLLTENETINLIDNEIFPDDIAIRARDFYNKHHINKIYPKSYSEDAENFSIIVTL